MIFKYGTYLHDQDEVMLRTSVTALMDTFNRRMGDRIEWTVIGVLKVDWDPDPEVMKAALTAKLQLLTDAYDEDYKDWKLLHDDATTESRHVVLNSETFGGTKVLSAPSFFNGPWTGRPEYLNCRTYRIVLGCEIRVGTGLYSWRERVIVRGTGGSKWRYSPRMTGVPQAQTLQTATSYWYIQEGEAVGREATPTPSAVLFPGIEHGEMRVMVYDTPRDIVYGSSPEMYPIQWSYKMEATIDMGIPSFVLPSIPIL